MLSPNGVFLDCTFGQGGHSREILRRISKSSKLFAFDLDSEAKSASKKITHKNFKFIQDNFKNIGNYFDKESLDGILIDCGVSSPQLDNTSRGFSFRGDAALDMRFGESVKKTCEEVINNYSERELKYLFQNYGEEKQSSRIAKKIVTIRKKTPISTTKELSDLVISVKKSFKKIHPATQVFQALRMEVNDEINNLKNCLAASKRILKKGGILVVISFHSLEDRMVKNTFKEKIKYHEKDIPFTNDQLQTPSFSISKVFKPHQEEIDFNPRSRSSKLRVIRKL
tara:strand:+ start:36157 stop:37005 length:849 start_codon:yes stop_codon:yes gene_type:complete